MYVQHKEEVAFKIKHQTEGVWFIPPSPTRCRQAILAGKDTTLHMAETFNRRT